MRILLHDFSGHPFQAELSRQLAGEGHTVEHVFSEQYVSGKGHLARQDGDAEGLSFTGLRLDIPFRKYAPLSRLRWERAYARHWISTLRSAEVDCVIACNLPLFTLFLFARFAKKRKLPWILWHQDIYSFALGDELRRKLPRPLAALGARMLIRMERYCARNAQHVVAIGDAFEGVYREWKIPSTHVSVIPNWAPLDKVFPVDRDNPRAAALFPDAGRLRLLYAGTIGRKHNPQLLVELLRAAEAEGTKPQLVVISEGEAADDLAAIAAADPLLPLTVLPFQPAEDLPEVLGSADVLVALLEVDATKFSIPSKVLTYMAAGRPILGLMPADNPAALDITETGGFVAAPDTDGARSSAAWLASLQADPALVTEVGCRTRTVAEDKFDVAKVAKEFELIIGAAVRP